MISQSNQINSSSKSTIQKEGPIMNSPSASHNIPTVVKREAQTSLEANKSSNSNEDEYTYEEVEIEELVTDDDAEDNEEAPSTAPISEHPITETDDQIPDYVLESSQASRISLPQPEAKNNERSSVDSIAVQEAIEAIEAVRDGNQSSRADMADDENTESDSASTEYEEIEVEVTDSEYDSESEPESEAVDFESAKSRLEDSHAHNLEEPTTKDSADSTSDSNSKPSIIYHPVENDALSESSGEYEEIELEIEVTDSEASDCDEEAQCGEEESNDVSLASVSLCHDTSKDEASDDEFPQSAPAPQSSAPIPISMSKANSTSNLTSSSPRIRSWLTSGSPGRINADIYDKRVHPMKSRKRTNTGP